MGSLTNGSKARITAVDTNNKNPNLSISEIPRKLLLIGSASSDAVCKKDMPTKIKGKKVIDSFGVGSALHQMINGVNNSSNNAFELYAAAVSEDESATEATADITVTGEASSNGTLSIYIGGEKVSVVVKTGENADTIHANIIKKISSQINLPVKASDGTGKVTLTSKWKGNTANDITLGQNLTEDELSSNPQGITVTLGTFSGGAGEVSLEKVLSNFGSEHYTCIATAFTDKTNLDLLMERAEELFSETENKGFYAIGGFNSQKSDYMSFIEGRNDKYFSAFWAEKSPTPTYMIAALTARTIENSLAVSTATQLDGAIDGILQGVSPYRNYEAKDEIVSAGGCTVIYNEFGEVLFENTRTTFKKADDGSESDAFSFIQTIGKIQLIQYELKTTFSKPPYYQAVLVSDESTPSPDVNAVKPITAKADVITLIRSWESRGILNNASSSIEGLSANIDTSVAGKLVLSMLLYFTSPLNQIKFNIDWTLQL